MRRGEPMLGMLTQHIIKNPAVAGFFEGTAQCKRAAAPDQLLDLGFLIRHVLANNGIKFHDLHFLRLRAFVFRRGVEVTSTGCRFQLDLVASAFSHDGAP
jgi:hypothetical protein